MKDAGVFVCLWRGRHEGYRWKSATDKSPVRGEVPETF